MIGKTIKYNKKTINNKKTIKYNLLNNKKISETIIKNLKTQNKIISITLLNSNKVIHKLEPNNNLKLLQKENEDKLQLLYDQQNILYDIKLKLLEKLRESKIPYNIKTIVEGLTRGVARYITANYKLKYPISNGFVKLWEIYNIIPELIKLRKNINVFHMAEAPGQWIHATDYFIYKEIIKNKDTRKINYMWYANALNPYNPKNIKLYGKELFKDTYGFIGKYPERWLYGEDNTGDITVVKNIKWFHNFLNDKFSNDKFSDKKNKLQLITGDAGIGEEVPLYIKQRIDIAQMIMVLTCLSKGGNCIIKHFLPFFSEDQKSRYGNNTYIGIIYMYYLYFNKIKLIKPLTSNPDSGEFYLVGIGFKGKPNENILNNLYNHLRNHKGNECWLKKEQLDKIIENKIINFFTQLINLNLKTKESTNNLMGELIKYRNNKNAISNDMKKLLFSKENNILNSKIKKWINDYKFN